MRLYRWRMSCWCLSFIDNFCICICSVVKEIVNKRKVWRKCSLTAINRVSLKIWCSLEAEFLWSFRKNCRYIHFSHHCVEYTISLPRLRLKTCVKCTRKSVNWSFSHYLTHSYFTRISWKLQSKMFFFFLHQYVYKHLPNIWVVNRIVRLVF